MNSDVNINMIRDLVENQGYILRNFTEVPPVLNFTLQNRRSILDFETQDEEIKRYIFKIR